MSRKCTGKPAGSTGFAAILGMQKQCNKRVAPPPAILRDAGLNHSLTIHRAKFAGCRWGSPRHARRLRSRSAFENEETYGKQRRIPRLPERATAEEAEKAGGDVAARRVVGLSRGTADRCAGAVPAVAGRPARLFRRAAAARGFP